MHEKVFAEFVFQIKKPTNNIRKFKKKSNVNSKNPSKSLFGKSNYGYVIVK